MGGAAARARVLMPSPPAQFTNSISSPVQVRMRKIGPEPARSAVSVGALS
jgi:hypothetical protein